MGLGVWILDLGSHISEFGSQSLKFGSWILYFVVRILDLVVWLGSWILDQEVGGSWILGEWWVGRASLMCCAVMAWFTRR